MSSLAMYSFKLASPTLLSCALS